MKELKPESIRNIVLLSYNGAGKTSLVEAILAAAGSIAQMGSIAAGTAAMDYEPEEHHRPGRAVQRRAALGAQPQQV